MDEALVGGLIRRSGVQIWAWPRSGIQFCNNTRTGVVWTQLQVGDHVAGVLTCIRHAAAAAATTAAAAEMKLEVSGWPRQPSRGHPPGSPYWTPSS